MSSERAIAPGTAVAVSYRLELDGGLTAEASQEAVWYVQGQDSFPLPLQRALVGKKKGDSVTVRLEAKDAFGERDPKLVKEVRRSQFKSAEPLSLGQQLIGSPDGKIKRAAVVVALTAQTVTVDVNHFWAGAPVTAKLHVVDVALQPPQGKALK
jgi:FKBP-type peptidyl-prolyl cis-trans isomerase 2